jgi:hypothetical protein
LWNAVFIPLKTFKEIITAFVYLALGIGFLMLVVWECTIGFAAGSFGGAGMRENPGLFWFLIALQILFGINFFSRALKGIADIIGAHIQTSVQPGGGSLPMLTAVIRVMQLVAFFFLGMLGIWAIIDLFFLFYSVIMYMQILDRVILGGLALLCLGTFMTLLFQFLLIPFLKDFYPSARSSVKFLIDEITSRKGKKGT